MHLSELKLWNFRKYGSANLFDRKKPNLTVPFKAGINVVIGENDAGKSAIVDAIRLVLGAHSLDWTKVTLDDFFTGSDRLRIELRFDALSTGEGKNFTEWLDWVGVGVDSVPCLRVFYEAARRDERILPSDVKAGTDVDGHQLSAEAKDYLRITYLKPLRDAKADLVPRRNSRLSQILQGHEAFKGKADTHHLVGLFREFNKAVRAYFNGTDAAGLILTSDQKGKEWKDAIETYLRTFTETTTSIDIGVVDNDDLRTILETLGLSILGAENPGLGTLNRMFMASELVHLNKVNWSGYLETAFYTDGRGASAKSYESQRLAAQFLGAAMNGGEGKRVRHSAKMVYVGFSRPTHLLCVAVHESHFTQYLSTINKSDWDVVRIGNQVNTTA